MIQANEDILAEDFINESEADPTPSNDAGRVAKLESDGKISPVFTGFGIKKTYGEQIDAGEPVFLANDKIFIIQKNISSSTFPAIDATNNYHAQSFTTGDKTVKIGRVIIPYFVRDAGVAGSITVRIEETTAGKPNGTVVATTTASITTGSNNRYNFTATFDATVLPSTEYAIVLDPSTITGLDGSNDIDLLAGGTGLAGGTYTSTDGSTWGSDTGNDLTMIIEEKFTQGRVYLMRNDIAGDGVNYFGIAKNTGNAGDTGTIQLNGINNDVTGLTIGQHYFASSTPGQLSTTPAGLCLGLAIDTDKLKIIHNEFSSGNTGDAYTLSEGGGFQPSSNDSGCAINIAPMNGMIVLGGDNSSLSIELWINNNSALTINRTSYKITGSILGKMSIPIKAGQFYYIQNNASALEQNYLLPANN